MTDQPTDLSKKFDGTAKGKKTIPGKTPAEKTEKQLTDQQRTEWLKGLIERNMMRHT